MLTAHSHWILSIAWSPDGKKIASGCKAGKVIIIIIIICIAPLMYDKHLSFTYIYFKNYLISTFAVYLCTSVYHIAGLGGKMVLKHNVHSFVILCPGSVSVAVC